MRASVQKAVTTIYGINIQTANYWKLPVEIQPFTTQNEKLNIFPNLLLGQNETPFTRYAVIGNGGHVIRTGANNIPLFDPVLHRTKDAGLYNQLPFVLRPLTNDLTPEQRLNYRLRRVEAHDGINYVAYYAKVIDTTGQSVKMNILTVEGDTTVVVPFQASINDLNPTPPPINNTGQNIATGDYMQASVKVPIPFLDFDITEFLNVCNIVYGDPAYAIVSEIGLCSGVDRTVQGSFNGVDLPYIDVVACQIVNFASVFLPFQYMDATVINLDTGSIGPVLNFINI